jgi:geranylgeranyl pyrophosphate synthase
MFLVNFGAIEMLSYEWLRKTLPNQKAFSMFVEKRFNDRVNKIIKLIKAMSLDFQLKDNILTAWNTAKDIAKVRNAIAHNPIVFVWSNRDEAGEPDMIGIPVLRSASGDQFQIVPVIDVNRLHTIVDDLADLAKKLHDLFLEVQKAATSK